MLVSQPMADNLSRAELPATKAGIICYACATLGFQRRVERVYFFPKKLYKKLYKTLKGLTRNEKKKKKDYQKYKLIKMKSSRKEEKKNEEKRKPATI